MVKKIVIVIVVLVVGYFAIAGILTVTGVCPKNIDLMPQVVGPGIPARNLSPLVLFCPFAGKSY